MAPRPASPAVPVERFFQFSLLGLVASGYLAVAGSGYLDAPTILLTAAGLVLRAFFICGWIGFEISERAATRATIAYSAFYVADYLALSQEFLSATVHLVFFLAIVKILTAKTGRDHLYTAVIAFVELVAAAILSVNFNFFLFLALYLLFAMAALTSGEIRRSMNATGVAFTARTGLKRFHPRLAGLTLTITAGILVMTGGFFFILPRTADAAFARLISKRMRLPGFSNQVNLGDTGEIRNNARPVMHVRIWGPQQSLKWRGGALVDFDGKRWLNLSGRRESISVRNGEADLLPPSGRRPGPKLNYEISFDELSTNALFFAGTPDSVLRLRAREVLRGEGDGYRLDRIPPPGFHYEAYSLLEENPETAPPLYPPPLLPLQSRERYLSLPPLDARIAALAREWTAGLPTELERARAIERRLRRDFGYTLQLPSREVPDPLAHFLFERRKGHCEYFASAMTVMLRDIGIPARLATGFQSGLFNPITDLWLVRASDAHTWVEAWLPSRGWTTFDPTPPDPNPPGYGLLSRFNLYLDAAQTFWQEWVVGYDAGQQGSLADRLEQTVRRLGLNWFDTAVVLGSNWDARLAAWGRRNGWRALGVLAFGFCLWAMGPPLLRLFRMRQRVERVRRGQASVADATLLYQRMLQIVKHHGYQKPVWFTPSEFAASLGNSPIAAPVTEFTSAYNALRFGGRTEVAPRLSTLLDELERRRP
jgi:transglutaminase-like putative cysteine protease